LEGVQPEGGRFRSFLLTMLNRFLANQLDPTHAQKPGGGQTNGSYVNDPAVPEVRTKMQQNALTSPGEADRMHKEFMKYVLVRHGRFCTPTVTDIICRPWVKNFTER
jgi:hypothetical protein